MKQRITIQRAILKTLTLLIAWAAGALVPLFTVARAADPVLNVIAPQGGQIGTELDVQLRGARLADAQELLLYEPGIEVRQLQGEANRVLVKLAIAPNCRLGAHALRIRTATGISPLRLFFVGPLTEILEKEPNSDFQHPQPIDLETTVNGVVETEDVDYFCLSARKGERISVEIEGLRLGRTFFDPCIALLNTEGFELARCDDAPLLHQDAYLSIVAPEDGQYIVEVRESAYRGDANCGYRLHVGRFPRPSAVFPAGGRSGETLEVRWVGDVLGERTETVTLPNQPVADFGLFAHDEHGTAPSANPFRLSNLENILEVEPNNDSQQATSATAPAALNGIIADDGDLDYFRFHASKGQVFDIRVLARQLRTQLDPVLRIVRAGGAGVAGNDDTDGPDSYVRFTAPEDDDYVLNVRDQLGQGGPDYVYRVEITPARPAMTLDLREQFRFVATRAEVPRGGRTAVLVTAARRDFNAPVGLTLGGTPRGVEAQTVEIPAGRDVTPLLLTAADDAPLGGTLVDLVGRSADEKLDVAGHLRQRTLLVRGKNNRDVWRHFADRMALAVTEKRPFSIEIVQPAVPLVQQGSMDLKVVANRDEGFQAPIELRMLYDPPGVSSSRSVRIGEGENEASIPLTASAGAAVQTWKIAVLGIANAGGRVVVSSQLADLDIAPPLLALTFPKTVVQQGGSTDFVVGVKKNRPLPSVVHAELVGLPGGATAAPLEISNDSTELKFRVTTTDEVRPGRHKSILCRAVAMQNDQPITQTTGSGELRIDEPLPTKDEKMR